MVRFKVDENLPREAAEFLCQVGHDAVTVRDQQMSGAPDHRVFSACQREGRVLVTLDTDFSDRRTYPAGASPGLVVLRLSRHSKASVMQVLGLLEPLLAREPLSGRLWIVQENRVRIREEHRPKHE